MSKRSGSEKQEDIWIAHTELAVAPGHPFYKRLNELLEGAGFDEFVEGLSNLVNGHYVRSHLYLARRLYREAAAEAKVAISIDPLSVTLNYHLGAIYYFSRQYDEAIEQLRKTEELEPLFVATRHFLACAYARKGRCQEALTATEKCLLLSGRGLRGKALCGGVYALLGKQLEARKILDEMKPACVFPNFFHAYSCAGIHATLGEPSEAFKWLDKAWQGRAAALVYMGSDLSLENLHGDPRFDDLLRRIGLPS